VLILEILGKPADYVKESLDELVKKLSEEKGVKILNRRINEPLPVKDSKELFTTFTELEVEFETVDMYLAVLFAYMPSHVEVVSPEQLTMPAAYFNELGNKIVQRMHNYDAITKKLLHENHVILEHLRKFAPGIFQKLTTAPQEAQPVLIPAEEKKDKPDKAEKKGKKKK
jgi:hypothetical protein